MSMLVFVVVGTVGGAVALGFGLRGRDRGTEPRCAACGFDLTGVWKGESGVLCPECGVELHHGTRRAGGVRRGTRRAIRPVVVGGALLMLAGVGVGGVVGWSRATQFDWNTVKPAWMLVRTVERSPSPSAIDTALRELVARANADDLAPEKLAVLESLTLEQHADSTSRWSEAWGLALGHFLMAGALDDDELARVVERSIQVSVRMRQRGLPGVHMPIAIETTFRQPVAPMEFAYSIERGFARVVGFETEPVDFGSSTGRSMTSLGTFARGSGSTTLRIAGSDSLGPGTHEVEWLFAVVCELVPAGEWQRETGDRVLPERESEWEGSRLGDGVIRTDAGRVAVVKAGRASVEVADDAVVWLEDDSDATRGDLGLALGVDDLRLEVREGRVDIRGTARVADTTPVPIAFRVWLRSGDRRWEIGSLAMPRVGAVGGTRMFGMASRAFATDNGWSWAKEGENPVLLDPSPLEERAVDVVFEADLGVAASSNIDMDEVWRGTVVIEDVPMRVVREGE